MASTLRALSVAGRFAITRSARLLATTAARPKFATVDTVAKACSGRRYFADEKDGKDERAKEFLEKMESTDQAELLAQSGGSYSASWFEPDALWDYSNKTDDSTVEDYDKVFADDMGARNKAWRKEMLKVDKDFFNEIGAGQAPKYLWIGCADSRVAAENMVKAKPGEIFVHRNIANMVVNTDTNLRAVLHYALDYLEVEHVIVCGHYDCGGVKAAMSNKDHSAPVESWLTNIRDVYRLHQEELEAILDGDERHKRFVELNVIEQCLNLFKTGDVQRRRVYTASRPHTYPCALPRIHAMVFAPGDGVLRRLPIDFKYYMKKYKNVYKMYDTDVFASYRDPASLGS